MRLCLSGFVAGQYGDRALTLRRNLQKFSGLFWRDWATCDSNCHIFSSYHDRCIAGWSLFTVSAGQFAFSFGGRYIPDESLTARSLLIAENLSVANMDDTMCILGDIVFVGY